MSFTFPLYFKDFKKRFTHPKIGVRLVLLTILFIPLVDGRAETTDYFIVDATIDAIMRDPRVGSAKAEHQATEDEVEITRGGYYPNVSAQMGMSNITQGGEYQVNMKQMLYDWGRQDSEMDSSRADSSLALEQVRLAEAQASFDAADAYLAYLKADSIIMIYNEYLSDLERLMTIAEQRSRGNFSSRVEVDRVRLEKARAIEVQQRFVGNKQDARQEFIELISVDPTTVTLHFAPELPILSWLSDPTQLDKAVRTAPSVTADIAEVEKAKAEVALTKAKLLPQLNVEADLLRREFNNDVNSDAVLALRFRTDNFSGLSNFRKPDAARSRLQAREQQVRNTQRNLRRNQQQLKALEPALRARMEAFNQQAESAEQILDTYQQQFFAGLRDFNDLLLVTRDKFEAKRQKEELKTELLRTQYKLASDFGMLIDMLEQAHDGK